MRIKFCLSVLLLALFPGLYGQTIILQEDFESGSLPSGWTRSQNSPSVGWEFGTDLGSQFFVVAPHTSYAASNDDKYDNQYATANNAAKDFLITPNLDLTAYSSTGVRLEMEYLQPGNFTSIGVIEISTDAGSSWVVIDTLATSLRWQHGRYNFSSWTNQNNLLIGFHHNDQAGWSDGFAIDDVMVTEIPTEDVALISLDFKEYEVSETKFVEGIFLNNGINTIDSLDLSYRVDGDSVRTTRLRNLNLSADASYHFMHPDSFVISSGGAFQYEVWISNVNGNGQDAIPANDSLGHLLRTVNSPKPRKNVVLANHTSANCNLCPDGLLRFVGAVSSSPRILGVNVHYDDSLEIPEGRVWHDSWISTDLRGTIDQYLFPGEDFLEIRHLFYFGRAGERKWATVPVAVSIIANDYDSVSRNLNVTLQAEFYGPADGDMRLNAMLVEDAVTGTGNGYDQGNIYNFSTGHPFEGLGNPIVGFEHDRTLRAVLGGPWGTSGVIPNAVVLGDSFSHTYSYTIPAGWNSNNMRVICYVSRHGPDIFSREIWNSNEASFGQILIGQKEAIAPVLTVAPNPFGESTRLLLDLVAGGNARISIFDGRGREVKVLWEGKMAAGQQVLAWDGRDSNGNRLSTGLYIIRVQVGTKVTVKRVVRQ